MSSITHTIWIYCAGFFQLNALYTENEVNYVQVLSSEVNLMCAIANEIILIYHVYCRYYISAGSNESSISTYIIICDSPRESVHTG